MRVAITGEATWTPDGIAPIRRFDASRFPVRFAAEIEAPGTVAMGLLVVREALGEVDRLRAAHDPARIGVFFGVEPERVAAGDWARVQGERRAATQQDRAPRFAGLLPEGAYRRRSPSRLTDAVADLCGARGPRRTLAMACVSSAAAIAQAYLAIARGEITAAIAGGAAQNVEPLLFAGFCLLGAMSPSGECRPFDGARDGFVLGDAAGALVLEAESAVHSGQIRGRLLGAGQSLDAYRMTDPEPEGRGAAEAIRAALTDASLDPRDIALVKAHATGTQKNDQVEARVIDALLPHRPPVMAVKGAIGHSIAASGVVEAIAALEALRRGFAPGIAGLTHPDPSLPPLFLAPASAEPRTIRGGVALCNTFGFGGINCALLLGAP